MLHKGHVSSRQHFGILLNSLNLLGTGVEIGTDRGYFAVSILDNWKGDKLYCVDPYELSVGYAEKGIAGTELARKSAYKRLSTHTGLGRCVMLQYTSAQAVRQFTDNTLSFVYVDGDHTLDHVRHDLTVWWPKIVRGGLLAGHDFICPGEIAGGWGRYVQEAVLEHAAKHNVDVYIIVDETDTAWSFYMIKL